MHSKDLSRQEECEGWSGLFTIGKRQVFPRSVSVMILERPLPAKLKNFKHTFISFSFSFFYNINKSILFHFLNKVFLFIVLEMFIKNYGFFYALVLIHIQIIFEVNRQHHIFLELDP